MKIRFPKIEYSVHIHPKPRGNWRPQVDFSLRIKVQKGECAWRPYLTGIAFVSQNFLEGYRGNLEEYTIIDGIKIYRVVDDFHAHCGIIGRYGLRYAYNAALPEGRLVIFCDSEAFRESPKRGEGRVYEALCFEWDNYLEEGVEIIRQATFYLPWRPSAKPDYSDYARIFSIVPKLLYKMLQDGLDSGISQEYKIGFVGSLGVAKKQKQEENEEVVFV